MQIIGALDIGGTKIAVGLVDASGQVLASRNIPTRSELPYAASLSEAAQALEELLQSGGVRLDGIGIGTTGQLLPGGVFSPNKFLPAWGGQDPARDLSVRFGVTSAVENDADAAALGEYRWGAGRGMRRFIYVTISTGIGGGVILDGNLYRGVDGAHPEIGHHVVEAGGPACFCGARGCWERMASGTAMAEWARSQGGDPTWDARRICDMAEAGDEFAVSVVLREAHYLGIGLANLVTLFTPECISLGGGLMQRWELFREDAQRVIHESCGLVPWRSTQLCAVELRQPGLAGAAAVWLQAHGGNQ